MLTSDWKTALVNFSVDKKVSEAVDLGGNYEFLTVIQPTLDNAATLTVHIGMTLTGTFYPAYQLDNDAGADYAQITTGLATARAVVFQIGGAQFVEVVVGTDVTSDKTFYVKGYDRG